MKLMENIDLDFSALTEPVTKQDMQTYQAYAKANPGAAANLGIFKSSFSLVALILGICFVLSSPILIMSAIDQVRANGAIGLISLLPFVVIFAVLGYFLLKHLYDRKKQAMYFKFAQRSGLEYFSGVQKPLPPGMIFDEGYDRQVEQGFVMPDGLQIANYQYTTGSGKNRSVHRWGYMMLELPRRLPHMVLDAKKNNIFGSRWSNLPDYFDKEQVLKLEGNFNNSYTLFAPQQYERDALTVFTPDVMAALIDANAEYDVELVDDKLILYSSKRFNLKDSANWQKLLTIADVIGQEVSHQSKTYADERVGSRQANIISEPGRRLQKKFNLVLFIIIFLMVAFMVVRSKL